MITFKYVPVLPLNSNNLILARIAFVLTFVINTSSLFAQKPLKTLVKENEKSIFLIQCYDAKGKMVSIGSGFFIENAGIAITNVHVIKDAYKAKIKTVEGKYYDVEKVIAYNPTLDIAKIRIKNPNHTIFPVVKMASKKSSKGEEVFAIGNPDGLENTVSTGIISSIRTVPNYKDCYQITAPVSPGSSGGALFNMEGEVIGITTFGQIDKNRLNQNLNFAINIENIRFLAKDQNISIEQAFKQISYEQFLPRYMQAILSGDYEQAIEICTGQIQLSHSGWSAYHYRATAYFIMEEYTLAEKDFLKAIQLNPNDAEKEWDYIGLGKIYRRSAQYDKAKENYMNALNINDKNPICYCNISVLAKDMLGADNELVEVSYMKALKLDPTSCSFGLQQIGQKLLDKKDYRKAAYFFTMSIETSHDEKISINEYFNRGNCFYFLKEFQNAVDDFKTCISMMPNDYQSYLCLGLTYYEMGKKLEACRAFKKAYEINEGFEQDKEIQKNIQEYMNQYCN
jgi:tetratricopeptide (TPR) repeat protein